MLSSIREMLGCRSAAGMRSWETRHERYPPCISEVLWGKAFISVLLSERIKSSPVVHLGQRNGLCSVGLFLWVREARGSLREMTAFAAPAQRTIQVCYRLWIFIVFTMYQSMAKKEFFSVIPCFFLKVLVYEKTPAYKDFLQHFRKRLKQD